MPRHERKTTAARAKRDRLSSAVTTTTKNRTESHSQTQTPPTKLVPYYPPPVAPPADPFAGLQLAVRIRLNRLKTSSQAQYLAALNVFDRTTRELGLAAPQTAAELDAQLEAFAEHVFAKRGGAGRQTVACARLACIWLNPALRELLPRSRAVSDLTAWNRAAGRTVQRHPPLTWPLVCVLAKRMTAAGSAAVAVAAMLSFDCALRIREASALRVGDVREISTVDARLIRAGAPELVLTIRDPKTSKHDSEQSVFVLNRAMTALLREWVAGRRAAGATDDELLFGCNRWQLSYAFDREAKRLGTSTRFTWHSLRHGAATLLFMSGWSTAEVMGHGRWVSEQSAWRYHQAGRAVVAAHGAPPALVQEGERIAAELGSTLNRPTAPPEI